MQRKTSFKLVLHVVPSLSDYCMTSGSVLDRIDSA
jgi:hypothetical protein